MSKIVKNFYEHLKTKKKYNTLEIKYREALQLNEEKIIQLEKAKEANREIKRKFDEEYGELLAKYLEIKLELKQQKKRKRN